MYTVSVPIILQENFDLEKNLTELRRLDATRVMLCPHVNGREYTISDTELARIKEYNGRLMDLGYEVCVWINSLGHGGPAYKSRFQLAVNAEGKEVGGVCPLDENVVSAFSELVRRIASTGVDALMLDDDYRFAFKDGVGCFCERHLRAFAERTGKHLTREELVNTVYTGDPTPERRVWLDLLGDSLLGLARALRAAADEVNPGMRLGLCSSPSTWDTDGVDSMELAKALAGPNTRPIHRFIGAPYWAQVGLGGHSLADTVELTKLEERWLEETDPKFAVEADTFAEGDVYPRPRYMTPSVNLEAYDVALRAAGNIKGILKYAIDYTSSPFYERGYCDRAERNRPLYAQVERRFAGKSPVGVRVFEPMKKLARMRLPEKFISGSYIEDLFFPQSIRYLVDKSIPIGDGPSTAVFGAAALDLPEDTDGCILDLEAARIITERGVDVGLRSIGDVVHPGTEYFIDENELVALTGSATWHSIDVDEKARLLTRIRCGKNEHPGAYLYENAEGRRFMVLAFTTIVRDRDGGATRSYCKRRMTLNSVDWLARAPLSVCPDCDAPDLYSYIAADKNSTAVLLWNGFADDILAPVIRLSEKFSRAEFFNCSGRLEDGRVLLDRIEPFGLALVEVFR